MAEGKAVVEAMENENGRAARLRVGVIGVGTRGRRHVTTLRALPEVDLIGVYDQRPEVADGVAAKAGVTSFGSLDELSREVEAATLAVPTFARPDVGKSLLERGLHVFVEEPLALGLEEADRLLAAKGDRILAVGHIGAFNPAIRAICSVDVIPELIELQRLLPFTPRALDLDVVLDLMLPQIQLLHAVDSSPVVAINATGVEVLSDKVDVVTARIDLRSGTVANLTASRAAELELSQLRLFQRHRYFCVDLIRQEVRGFGLRIEEDRRLVLPELMTVHHGSPLRLALEGFIAACRGKGEGYVSGQEARRALATALKVRSAIDAGTPGAGMRGFAAT